MKPLLLLFALWATSSVAFAAPLERYGVFVGANDGGRARAALKYAEKDAEAVARVFSQTGGIPPTHQRVIQGPTRRELLQTIGSLGREINARPQTRSELIFYYSGHSDADALLLGEERLDFVELKRAIEGVGAKVHVLIFDSCYSGSFAREKGGKLRPQFLQNSLFDLQGRVVLTSSSEREPSRESDLTRGSYFTHYLLAALRGSADKSGDRRVTLNEVYEYAYGNTLRLTEQMGGGLQHPSFQIDLKGRGELVLSELLQAEHQLRLGSELSGRILIYDSKRRLVADFDKVGGKDALIAVGSDETTVLVEVRDGEVYQARLQPSSWPSRSWSLESLASLTRIRNEGQRKGLLEAEGSQPGPLLDELSFRSQALGLAGGSTAPGTGFHGLDFGLGYFRHIGRLPLQAGVTLETQRTRQAISSWRDDLGVLHAVGGEEGWNAQARVHLRWKAASPNLWLHGLYAGVSTGVYGLDLGDTADGTEWRLAYGIHLGKQFLLWRGLTFSPELRSANALGRDLQVEMLPLQFSWQFGR